MKLSIQKWGNSASVRLPAALLEQMGASIGSALEVSITDEGLLLKPERRPQYTLNELLSEMADSQLPDSPLPDGKLPVEPGWDDMPAAGQEVL